MNVTIRVNAENVTTGEIGPQMAEFIHRLVTDLSDTMKRSFAGPKSGRIYRRSHETRRRSSGNPFRRLELIHRASAPGEAPANDTGSLARSFKMRFPSQFLGELEIGAAYAEFLELGTGRMAARPYVGPAIRSVTAQLQDVSLTSAIFDVAA